MSTLIWTVAALWGVGILVVVAVMVVGYVSTRRRR